MQLIWKLNIWKILISNEVIFYATYHSKGPLSFKNRRYNTCLNIEIQNDMLNQCIHLSKLFKLVKRMLAYLGFSVPLFHMIPSNLCFCSWFKTQVKRPAHTPGPLLICHVTWKYWVARCRKSLCFQKCSTHLLPVARILKMLSFWTINRKVCATKRLCSLTYHVWEFR